jgi:hypothetical protein
MIDPTMTSERLDQAVLKHLTEALEKGVVITTEDGEQGVVQAPAALVTAAIQYLKAFPPKREEDVLPQRLTAAVIRPAFNQGFSGRKVS